MKYLFYPLPQQPLLPLPKIRAVHDLVLSENWTEIEPNQKSTLVFKTNMVEEYLNRFELVLT